MKKQLVLVLSAASLVFSAQAQNSSSDSSSSSSTSGQNSQYGSSSDKSGWTGKGLSAAGRMGHQEIKASQLTGAQVTGTSGSQLGTISDCIINPTSGRIDFAILSVSGSGSTGGSTSPSGSSSSTGSSDTSGSSSSTSPSSTSPSSSSSGVGGSSGSTLGSSSSSSLAGGKQVAVPWMLLKPSDSGSSSSSTASSSTSSVSSGQVSFQFTGDPSKLQSAPSFDATTDLSQPNWRHSVYSYYGLSGAGSATGGGESPGSSSSGSSSSDSSSNPK